MLSSIVTSLVSKYLGEFVVLAPEQLSLGLASGQVNVQNVRFRPEALRDLNLPITVREGVLGHLKISVPWTSIWSSPTQVVLEDIYLLAEPKQNVYDDDFEKRIQATKERFLQMRDFFNSPPASEEEALERARLQEAAATGGAAKGTWTERVMAAIVNNVQIRVERVHVRFEEARFACGLSLESFSAVSCDEKYEARMVGSSGGLLYKLCSMDAMSVYWDSQCAPLKYDSVQDFSAKMREQIGRSGDASAHQYLLQPVSGTLQAAINQYQEPKLRLRATFEKLHVAMHETQMRDALTLGERFRMEVRGAAYRRLRPARPGATPREMWHYVVGAVRQDLAVRRSVWSWPWIQAMMNDRRDYVHVWCQSKVAGGIEHMSMLDQEKLSALEFRLEYDSIVQFRQLGELLFERKVALADQAKQNAQAEGGWLGRVVWGTPQAERQRVLEQDMPVTGTLLQDLTRELLARERAAAAREKSEIAHEGVVADLVLQNVTASLHTFEPVFRAVGNLLQAELDTIGAHISIGSGKAFSFEMKSLSVSEFVSVPERKTLAIARRKTSKGGEEALLSIAVELNPPARPDVDVVVSLEARPLEVLFSMPVVDRLAKFFTSTESVMLDELLAQAQESMAGLQREVVNQVRGIASGGKTSRVMLSVNVDAPIVVMPANFVDPNCARAVASLGTIRLKSVLADEKSIIVPQKDGKMLVSMDYFYQQAFSIAISNIQLLVCNQEDWEKASPRCKVLNDFGLDMALSLLTFPTHCLPKVKLRASLSPLQGNICAESLIGVMQVLETLSPKEAQVTVVAEEAPALGQPAEAARSATSRKSSKALELSGREQLTKFFETGPVRNEQEDVLPAELDNFVFDRSLFDLSSNPKVVDGSFSIERIDVALFKVQSGKGRTDTIKDILALQGTNVALQFDQRRKDIGVRVHVTRLGVADKLAGRQSWLLDGMQLPEGEVLLHCSYTGIPRSSPLFAGIDHELKVKLSNVGFSFNRETILYVLDTVDTLNASMHRHEAVPAEPQMDSAEGAASVEESLLSVSSAVSLAASRPTLKMVAKSASQQALLHDSTTNLSLTVILGSVAVQLAKDLDVFAVLEARGSEVTVDVRCNGTMSIDTSFGWFELRAPNSSSKWPKIAYTKRSSTETAIFCMETFLPQVDGYRGVDSRLELQMSTVKLVYRAAFVEEFVAYFQEMEIMRNYLFSAAEAVVETGAKSTLKMALDVTINNPYIKVPCSSTSDEYLKLDLGKTTAMSSFDNGVQKVSLGVNEVGLSWCATTRPEASRDILKKFDVALLVHIPVPPNPLAVSVIVSPVELQVDSGIMEFFIQILEGNLSETYEALLRPPQREPAAIEVPALGVSSDTSSRRSSINPNNDAVGRTKKDGVAAMPMELSVRVEEVSLTVVSIASFHVRKLFANVSASGDVGLVVETLLMSDRREERSQYFGEVISRRENPKTKGSYRATLAEPTVRCQTDLRGSSMSVVVNPIRVVVILDCLMKLHHFQEAALQRLTKVLAARNSRGTASDGAAIVPALVEGEQPKSEGPAMALNVVLKGLEAFVIEDLRNTHSRALVVGVSGAVALEARSNALSVDVELNDFAVNKVLTMSSGVFASIVSPWRVGMSYNSVVGCLERIEVICAPLDIVFSHGDYLLCMALSTQALHAIDPTALDAQNAAVEGRAAAGPELGKIVLEPPRAHRELSNQYFMLQAETVSLRSDPNRVLSIGSASNDGNLLCLAAAGKGDETWLYEDGSILAGNDPQIALMYNSDLNCVTASRDKRAQWIFDATDGRVRLAAKPTLMLTAVGDWVELREAEDDPANQLWVFGKRAVHSESAATSGAPKTPQHRSGLLLVQSCNVVMQHIKAKIVDDTVPGQIEPLMSIDFQRFTAFAGSWSDDLSLVVDVHVQADHFDSRLQNWEPMLRGMNETRAREGVWKCQIVACTKDRAFGVDIVAKRVLTFNVTRAMMSSFRRLTLVWTGTQEQLKRLASREISHLPSSSALREILLKPDPKSNEQVHRPYVISNKTGHTIRWYIGTDAPKTLSGERGHNIAFWTPDAATSLLERNLLSIYLENEIAPSLKRLPIDGARVLCFTVGTRRTLVYEVRYEMGSRILEVRSNMHFVSELLSAVPLYSSKSPLGVLEPQGSLAVPLVLSLGSITLGQGVRLTDEAFDQDTLKACGVVALNGVLKHSRCVRGSGGMVYAITATGTPDVMAENAISWEIVVKAPFRARNLLNVDVFIRLRNAKKEVIKDEVRIKPGDTSEFLFVPDAIALRHGDHAWSQFAPVKAVTVFAFHSGGEILVDNVSEGMSTNQTEATAQILTFWIPFWIVNNTARKVVVQEIPLVPFLERNVPVMYSGRELNFSLMGMKTKARIELASAPAAGTISLDVIEFGVRVFAAPSHFWRTKIVQLDDKFHLANMCDRRICIGQAKTAQQVFVEPNEQICYQWHDAAAPRRIRVRVAEDKWLWSGSFEIKEVSLFEVVVAKDSGVRTRLTVQTTTDAPVTAVIVRPSAPGFSIYRLVNNTRAPIVMYQSGVESDNGEYLNPKENVPYAWPEPATQQPLVLLGFPTAKLKNLNGEVLTNKASNLPSFSLDTVETYHSLVAEFEGSTDSIPLDVRVYFNGPTKILEVSEHVGIRGGINLVRNNSRIFVNEDNIVTTTVTMQLRGLSIALIDSRPREILHMQFSNVRATYEDGTKETMLGLDVKRIQVDNMLYNPLFPIVFWPMQPDNLSFLHVAVNQAKGHQGITFFNGIEVVLQEAEIRVDEGFATHLMAAVNEIFANDALEDMDWSAVATPVPDYRKTEVSTSDMVYARVLYVGPLRVLVSYSSCPWGKVPLTGERGAQMEQFLDFVNEVNSVYINLGMLNLDNAYHSKDALSWLVVQHYEWQLMQGFFSLLGALPILGAPVEMFRGVTTGVKSVFFLPAQGVTRSPADFGDGLRRGSTALFQGTIGTLMREVGKVTTTASTLAAKLTLDDEYKQNRAIVAKHQAKGAGQGLLYAARDVGTGFLGGITGVIMNPIKGAQKRGLAGFGQGVVSGFIGVLAKPLVGILDATSQISHGIQNGSMQARLRLRRPRPFDHTASVLAYDGEKAEAQEVLHSLEKSLHAMSIAVFLYPNLACFQRLVGGKFVPRRSHALISNKAVFSIVGRDVTDMTLEWRMAMTDIQRVLVKGCNVVFVSKARQEVREIKLVTKEEALLMYRKVMSALDHETERTLESIFTPARLGPSTMKLVERLEGEAAVSPRRALQLGDKGKDEEAQ